MKKIYLLTLAAIMTLFTVSCTEEKLEPEIPAPTIQDVTGIEPSYELGLHEFLEINPEVLIDNDNVEGLSYEWIIDYNVVSTEKNLKMKCSQLGDFTGNFKVVSKNGAIIKDFRFSVTSPYDTGLLLLSETKDGAMLTFKRLDIMDGKASPLAFKDNNPGLELGKSARSIAWMGASLTNVGKAIDPETDLNLYLATGNPTKVYCLDSRTLKAKNEIVYNGEGTFDPGLVYVPFGFQNDLWDGSVYFTGNGKEYCMTPENKFIKPEISLLPEGYENAKLADMVACIHFPYGDFPRVYFDENSHKLIYMGGTFFSAVGNQVLPAKPLALIPFNGEYRERRYEPYHFVFVGADGSNVKVFNMTTDFNWDTMDKADEIIEGEIDATGKILPESAIGANPIQPILYYSNGSKIYRLNVDGKNFDSEPYIDLGGNFAVKKMVFNQFDQNTLYIAAEDLDEKEDMKASIFVYDISDKQTGKQLFAGHKVGGTVKDLIYKGNGKEYTSAPKEDE